MSNSGWCLRDYMYWRQRERAASNDPFHPIRRSKGDKARNRSRRN